MITGVHHFALSVADADRSVAFYRDHFGLEVAADRVVDTGGYVERITGVAGAVVRIVHLRGHGVMLELLEYRTPRGALHARPFADAGSAHVCFVSDDLDADLAALVAAGVRVVSAGGVPVATTSGPNRGGRGVYVEDPDGNGVEVVELAR